MNLGKIRCSILIMMCGWFGANKVSPMKVKSLTGFMLGNERCAHHIGGVWADYDTRVWICPNLAKVEKVLQNSQQNSLEPAPRPEQEAICRAPSSLGTSVFFH